MRVGSRGGTSASSPFAADRRPGGLQPRAHMKTETKVRFFRWTDIPKERVTDTISRRLVTGDRMMLAHVYLDKGAIVPKHSHENEQLTYILEGALRFWIGEDQQEEIVVNAGEVLHIPSNVPHKAEALEDTLDVDVFSPPRQDWLNHTDSYFHRK
jgi:quercetin dioxygenase-like cupin family protein